MENKKKRLKVNNTIKVQGKVNFNNYIYNNQKILAIQRFNKTKMINLPSFNKIKGLGLRWKTNFNLQLNYTKQNKKNYNRNKKLLNMSTNPVWLFLHNANKMKIKDKLLIILTQTKILLKMVPSQVSLNLKNQKETIQNN